jgi:hypothetical protein
MNTKYIAAGLIGFSAILAWNIFCIQRDDAMFKAHYRQQAIDNLKYRPSSTIK